MNEMNPTWPTGGCALPLQSPYGHNAPKSARHHVIPVTRSIPAAPKPDAARPPRASAVPETATARTPQARANAYTASSEATELEGVLDQQLVHQRLTAAIDRWGDTVLRVALARTGSQADAEDVFQTVFLRFLQARRPFRGSEHEKAWILRVTINCCNDLYRSPHRLKTGPLEEAPEAALACADPTQEPPHDEELHRALGRLTEKQRTAVHLFYFEGYATEEVAAITGERPSTVRSHLHRARTILKRELGVIL